MSVRTVLLASVSVAFLTGSVSVQAFAAARSPAELLADQAYKSLATGDAKQAISGYSTAIETRQLPVETLANALVNRGLAYQRIGDDQRAIDDYSTALRIDAMDAKLRAMALYNRGLATQKLGRPAQAIEDFTSALFLDPQFSFAYYSRGELLRQSGQYLFALSDLEKALRFNYPHHYLVHFAAALAHEGLHRRDNERNELLLALADNPNFDPARSRLTALGGIVPPLANAMVAVDTIETASTSPQPGASAVAESPKSISEAPVPVVAVEVANARELKLAAVAGLPATSPKPHKYFTDRIPQEAEAPKPAAIKDASPAEAAEKIIAVEPVPDDEPAPMAAEQASSQPTKDAAQSPQADAPKPTGWAVQISSQKDEKIAWNVWNKLKAKHALLEGLTPVVMKADLGARGIVYRLRLAGFDGQAAAKDMCSRLKSRGISCYVSRLNS